MFVCDRAGKLTRRSMDLEDFHGARRKIKRSQAINVAESEYLWFQFGRNQSFFFEKKPRVHPLSIAVGYNARIQLEHTRTTAGMTLCTKVLSENRKHT
jgi:hypothetical protein